MNPFAPRRGREGPRVDGMDVGKMQVQVGIMVVFCYLEMFNGVRAGVFPILDVPPRTNLGRIHPTIPPPFPSFFHRRPSTNKHL